MRINIVHSKALEIVQGGEPNTLASGLVSGLTILQCDYNLLFLNGSGEGDTTLSWNVQAILRATSFHNIGNHCF
jgi:hypothetical protein